ncbi:MAG: hypothetical protein GY906_07870 [bacterium]|nr:hypothetical protein [bacterium]
MLGIVEGGIIGTKFADSEGEAEMSSSIDISDYYNIVSIDDHVIHDELKGFWSDQIIDEIGPEFLKLWEDAVKSFNGRPFITLTDWSDCSVMTDKAKEYLAKAMTIFKQHNGRNVVEVVPKTTTRLSIEAAARNAGAPTFRTVVTSLSEALDLVKKLKDELP